MLSYLPLLITFALGCSGVWFKTRRESPAGVLNQPTAGGWLVLSLMVASLAVGLNQEYRKQRQGRLDAEKTELATQKAAQQSQKTIDLLNGQLKDTRLLMAGSDAQLAIASREVAFLRRLFLLQHELSSVELGWHLSERDLGTLEAAVQRAKNEAGLTSEERTDFAYLQTALRYGRVEVYQTTRSRSILRIRLGRPQGLLWKRLGEDSVQWLALERALQAYLSERFEVQIAPGVFLANLARSHWPCGITLENGAIAFTIDRPGVRMGDLENASVVFWAGDAKERGLPAMIRLTSRDSRVSFDRAFHLSWRRVVLQSVVDADEHLNEYANFTAGPYRLPTVMVSTLTEVEAIGH